MSPGTGMHGRSELGSASVLVLVLLSVLSALALGAAAVDALLVGQRRAAAAADLAALAAAETLSPGADRAPGAVGACEEAEQVTVANNARLTGCVVQGLVVDVEVAVEVRSAFGAGWSVPGRARAGPAPYPTGAVTGFGGPVR